MSPAPILADLMRVRSRESPALRIAVRAGAAGAIAAAVAVPLLRRRLRIPAPVTVAACAAGPLALAVLYPRSNKRDVGALRAPDVGLHDGPRAPLRRSRAPPRPAPDPLPDRRRPRDRPRPAAERPPPAGASPGCPGSGSLNRVLTWVHWLWFFEPYAALLYILIRHPERFPRAARQMAAVFDLGCVVYFAVPTAPPWWASEQGLTGEAGAADHGRGRRGDLGRRLAEDVRRRSAATPGRRCPRCTSRPR